MCWTSDGKGLLVVGTDGEVSRVEVDSDHIERVAELGALQSVSSASTGNAAAFCTLDGRIGCVSSDSTIAFLSARGAEDTVAIGCNRDATVTGAVGGDERLVLCADAADATTIEGFPTAEMERSGAVAVEASLVAWSSSSAIRLWNSDARKEMLAVDGHRGRVTSVHWLGGDRILTSGSDQRIIVWDSARATIERERRSDGRHLTACAVSADSMRICTADMDGTIHVYDANDLSAVASWKANILSITGLAFSPDGRRIASAGGGGHARIWDIATSTMVADLHDAVRVTNFVEWCPTGARVVFGAESHSSSPRLVSIDAAHWRLEWRDAQVAWLHGIAFDQDGRLVAATARGDLHVVDAATGKTTRTLGSTIKPERRKHRLEGSRCISAGRRGPVAWADDEFQIHVSDAALSKETSRIAPTDMRCRALALDPEGRRLAVGGTRGQLCVWTVGSSQRERPGE